MTWIRFDMGNDAILLCCESGAYFSLTRDSKNIDYSLPNSDSIVTKDFSTKEDAGNQFIALEKKLCAP